MLRLIIINKGGLKMKLSLNELGKTFEFEYLSGSGELILLKGILTFN